MKIAIVGATGLVGGLMRELLATAKVPVSELILVASEASVGRELDWKGTLLKVVSMETAIASRPHIAIFSAGGQTALDFAPRFAEVGAFVVDNSSAFRMNPACPLVVADVNIQTITADTRIIANPNCSTMQLVSVLKPLHDRYGLRRLVISTYQAVSGTGQKAVEQYEAERQGLTPEKMVYAYPIFQNCIPHCDVFLENDYTKEEMKMVHETRKILNAPNIGVTATAVRVPVLVGHSESVNVEFEQEFDLGELRELLAASPALVIQDSPADKKYPMPLYAAGRDEVFVGRIRRDESQPKTLNMWVVADNLRKGAASNAIQLVEYIVANFVQK
jgi:aspartate-semialdehyde dehydrogenase